MRLIIELILIAACLLMYSWWRAAEVDAANLRQQCTAGDVAQNWANGIREFFK